MTFTFRPLARADVPLPRHGTAMISAVVAQDRPGGHGQRMTSPA